MADGERGVKKRSAARGHLDLDLEVGLVGTSGRARLQSSRFQAIPLSALKKWKPWSSDIRNADLQADGFNQEVYLRTPPEWDPLEARRARRLRPPAAGGIF